MVGGTKNSRMNGKVVRKILFVANESTILTMVGGTKNSRMNGKVVWKILFVANESTILTKNYLWHMKKKKKKVIRFNWHLMESWFWLLIHKSYENFNWLLLVEDCTGLMHTSFLDEARGSVWVFYIYSKSVNVVVKVL